MIFQKTFLLRDPFPPFGPSLVCPKQKETCHVRRVRHFDQSAEGQTREKQDALIALLKQNTDTVIRTLHGWKTTRLIAAKDGAGVVIYSEWETPAAVEAMRSDPRMKAYFPKIIELASLDSIVGSAVLSETR